MTQLPLKRLRIPRLSFFITVTLIAVLYSTASIQADDSNSNSKVITDDASTLKVISPTSKSNGPDDSSYNVTAGKKKIESTHGGKNNSHGKKEGGGHKTEGLVVASWNYHEIRDPLIFTLILVLAGVCKIVYHHAGFLSSKIPESCILIVLGTVFGALIHFTDAQETFPTFFRPHEFFVFLLPPIILEAAYSLHDRTFIENLGSILLFAVVGTILACVFVGLSLFGLANSGAMGSIEDLGFVELMVFSSLIVAVDPVAVLAVFNEIGVNHVLYFLVFGESLLNDGVTVVLYKVFQAYNVMDEITGAHIVLGIVKFFVVCLGGWFLGVLAGVASAVITKYATHVKVAQPLIIYTMAYLGFLCAELFEFSGIICIVGCGITQKQYAFNNISDKSKTTINYFTKVISTACETIIFMFLGLSMVNDHHVWHTGFTIWTILLCDVYRFIIIIGLSFLINKFDIYRVRKISWDEQFMIAYGGLRGAVCFSLVALLSPDEFPAKRMFVTTTLAVIIFTVFIQGITIKPLVYLLQIKLAPEKQKSMYKELQEHVTDHLMAGVEDIIGDHGKNHLRERMQYLDARYVKPLLLVEPDPCDTRLKEFYEHLMLKEHYNHMKFSNAKQMDGIPDLPHVTTELFLKGLLSPPAIEDSGMLERTPSTVVDVESQSPGATATPGDEEVVLRGKRSRTSSREKDTSRSSSLRTSSTHEVKNASDLRSLLRQRQPTNSRLARYDPNLTFLQDFQSEFRKKTDQNRRLQRLSSMDGTNPRLAAQLSWCEADSEAAAQRRNVSVKEKRPGPRHAATMDLQNHGRQATVDPLSGADVLFARPPRPFLDSVHEENEEEVNKNESSSSDEDDDDENQAMLEDETDGKEARIGFKDRKRRKSSKHKLERQGGMDKQASDSGEVTGQGQTALPMKNLDCGSGDVVRVDIEGGRSSINRNDEDTSKM